MSVCRCTAYEVCFPCRDREAHPDAPPPAEAPDACPFCPDGHRDPESTPWAAWVAPGRDRDGQPEMITVARTAGGHVAESDAEWVRARLNPTSPRHAADAPDWPVDDSGLCTRHGHRSTENGYGEMVCLTCADERRAADAPDVAPATDEQIAGYEKRMFREAWRVEDWEYALDGVIARVRQAERRAEQARATGLREAWEDAQGSLDSLRIERDRWIAAHVAMEAEAARLREQVAAMQAADAGAFW